MIAVSSILTCGLLFAIVILFTNASLERYDSSDSSDEVELPIIKCQVTSNPCEAYCSQQKTLNPSLLNDVNCSSSGYQLHFLFSNLTVLRPGWFVNSAVIKKLTIRDSGKIAQILPGAFDDCTFRSVMNLEIRGTAIKVLQKGALAGLNNLRNLSLYENTQMKAIEENALEGLFQLEEFIMEEHKQLSDLNNITGTIEWKYLRSLTLSNNCLLSTIKKPTFKGCTRVQVLNLSNSDIDAIGPHSFEPMEATIEVLDLSNNRLKHLPSGLLENMIRPNVRFLLSKNLWDCECVSLELQGYEIYNPNLICDGALICETPKSVKDYHMRNVSLSQCYSTTPFYPSTPYTTPPESPPNLDRYKCFDQTDSDQTFSVAVELEYQFFKIKQDAVGKVSIEITYPDQTLALIFINDHDYEASCQYDLKRIMTFDSLHPSAGYIFCLIKKNSYTTSPRNCLPFHFSDTFIWGRDKIIISLVCSFALAVVIGLIIGWLLICRYRRAFKSKDVLRYGSSRNSRTKIISDDFNSWSNYNRGTFYSANLRRSYSENSLASCKSYMTPSPLLDITPRKTRTSNDYHVRNYMDRLPYDLHPPPLPPHNACRERIYETIGDPPCNCTSDLVPYIYLRRC